MYCKHAGGHLVVYRQNKQAQITAEKTRLQKSSTAKRMSRQNVASGGKGSKGSGGKDLMNMY